MEAFNKPPLEVMRNDVKITKHESGGTRPQDSIPFAINERNVLAVCAGVHHF